MAGYGDGDGIMDRRKTGDVLFYALQCAKSDRQAYLDAIRGDTALEIETQADIKAFTQLQYSLFGTMQSKLDVEISKMIKVSLWDIRKFMEDHPEVVITE